MKVILATLTLVVFLMPTAIFLIMSIFDLRHVLEGSSILFLTPLGLDEQRVYLEALYGHEFASDFYFKTVSLVNFQIVFSVFAMVFAAWLIWFKEFKGQIAPARSVDQAPPEKLGVLFWVFNAFVHYISFDRHPIWKGGYVVGKTTGSNLGELPVLSLGCAGALDLFVVIVISVAAVRRKTREVPPP